MTLPRPGHCPQLLSPLFAEIRCSDCLAWADPYHNVFVASRFSPSYFLAASFKSRLSQVRFLFAQDFLLCRPLEFRTLGRSQTKIRYIIPIDCVFCLLLMFVHNVCLLEILIDAYGIQYVSTTLHFMCQWRFSNHVDEEIKR